MSPRPSPRPRPARSTRWAATGITAAVTVGSVGAMRAAEEATDGGAEPATVLGAAARLEADALVREMTGPADPGPTRAAPGQVVGHARVS